MKSTVFCDIVPCYLVQIYWRSTDAYGTDIGPDDGGSKLLWNVNYRAQRPNPMTTSLTLFVSTIYKRIVTEAWRNLPTSLCDMLQRFHLYRR
jgi:hypothetical protein